MIMNVKQVCYWLVGRSVCIDLHGESGELIRPHGHDEPIMIEVDATSESERLLRGRGICIAIALSHGLDKDAVTFDEDSTAQFSDED